MLISDNEKERKIGMYDGKVTIMLALIEDFKITEEKFLDSDIALPPKKDPLLVTLGMIDVPPFSEKIDDTLYSSP